MKMKIMKNKNYLQQKFSQKALVPRGTANLMSRVSKSYVPFKFKFPMVMHFVLIFHKRCRSKTNFYVFSYNKTKLKFCASFRIFLAVFKEKFKKICYLYYVRLTGVNPEMPLQFATLYEPLATELAFIRPVAGVCAHVVRQFTGTIKSLPTLRTFMVPLSRVDPHVFL